MVKNRRTLFMDDPLECLQLQEIKDMYLQSSHHTDIFSEEIECNLSFTQIRNKTIG